MTITPDEIKRYSQQLKLNEIGLAGQLKLKNAKVLCIGAGGLGSSLSFYLAAAGVGTIGIVDDDIVELSNLQRQILYQDSAIGNKKVIFAKQQLLALNPHITINIYPERFNVENAKKLISQYDIVADCSDNFATRYLTNDACFYLNKPYVFASVSQYQGQCALFFGEKSACFRCLFPSIPADNPFANCNEGGVLGVLPGLLGIIQATEIIKWILDIGKVLINQLFMIDLLTMDVKKIHLEKNPECRLCIARDSLELLIQHEKCDNFDKYAISFKELQFKLNNKEDILLVDVRSQEEHKHSNLGGISIPLPELFHRLSELNLEKLIIVYCQSGPRSIRAAHLLIENNFRSVRFLRGGVTQHTFYAQNFF